MAYVCGLLTPEECQRLENAGYDLEECPRELEPSDAWDDIDAGKMRMVMVWVDCSIIDLLKEGIEFAEKGKDNG